MEPISDDRLLDLIHMYEFFSRAQTRRHKISAPFIYSALTELLGRREDERKRLERISDRVNENMTRYHNGGYDGK